MQYGEIYAKAVEKISNEYRQQHNLYLLKSFRDKAKCFQKSLNPNQYYQCFQQIEGTMMRDSNDLKKNHMSIDDEYKLCIQNCKDTHVGNDVPMNACVLNCGNIFNQSIQKLYANFYKQKVGKEPEFKRLKK